MKTRFTVKKTTLALLLLAFCAKKIDARLTDPTAPIHGSSPELKDLNLSTKATGNLKRGNEIELSYTYIDTDGDEDDSASTVKWYATVNGKDHEISNSNIDNSTAGKSKLTIPFEAVGATTLKVTIIPTSKTGYPKASNTPMTISDIFNNTYGTSITNPKGEISADFIAGIYVSTDNGFTKNLLIDKSEQIEVGKTYVFKLWGSSSEDLTSKVEYEWHLLGRSATDNTAAPATEGFKTRVSNGNFTVPINQAAKDITGSDDGAQGFSLAVDWHIKSQN